MYVYKYKPRKPEFSGSAASYRGVNPKFIIVCAQHGFEKSSIYGTYYLVKDILNNYKNNIFLSYYRTYVELIIVPCTNSYGIDNNQYTNANSVNLNRNWPVKNWTKDESIEVGSTQYSGESAGDQPEVKNISSVIDSNRDAFAVIDYHTNGSSIVEKKKINWISMSLNSDTYRNQFVDAANWHICNITLNFEEIYKSVLGDSEDMCGFMDGGTTDTTIGYLSSYGKEQGFISMTFEGFNGFPLDDSAFSDAEKKANSELLGNFILSLCSKYSSK